MKLKIISLVAGSLYGFLYGRNGAKEQVQSGRIFLVD